MALVPLRSHGTAAHARGATRDGGDVDSERYRRPMCRAAHGRALSETDWNVKRKGRSRTIRRFLWRAVAAVIFLGVFIPAVVGPVIGVVAGLVALPFVVVIAALALVVLLIGLSIAGAVAAGIIGLPAWLIWRASRPKDETSDGKRTSELPEDGLKRRYLAGTLTHMEYRDEMLAVLKGQFSRGEIDVNDYEAEVEHLIRASQNADRRRPRSRALHPDGDQ